jgi:hypothetical protein
MQNKTSRGHLFMIFILFTTKAATEAAKADTGGQKIQFHWDFHTPTKAQRSKAHLTPKAVTAEARRPDSSNTDPSINRRHQNNCVHSAWHN